MPDEIKKAPTNEPDDTDDVNLVEELDSLNAGSGPVEEGKGEVPPTPSTPDQSALATRLDKLEEENISLRQRVDIQNGQISILRQPGDSQKPEEPPVPKRIRIPTREELAQKLSDPATAVQGMHELLSDLGTQFQEIIDETRTDADRNFRTRDFSSRVNAALAEDQRSTIEEYGQDLIRDPDFIRDADAEGDKLGRRRGHTNYNPGDFNLLATRTYKNWLESGKYDEWKAKRTKTTNGIPTSNRTPSLREVTRSVGRSDFVDTSNGRGTETSSLSELYGGDAREIRIARANMKRMGMSEKDWIASFKAAKSEDPSFGN